LHIADKAKARDELAKVGITLLDSPVSGTRTSILGNTLALYGSGDEASFKAWLRKALLRRACRAQ
jgi:3-hydroxyisobutyrate dehydrogenase-like beta-hydroxyacid dehydrogenase